MLPGDRKRSATTQRFTCCDNELENSAESDNSKIPRLDNTVEQENNDSTSRPNNVLISLGDHETTDIHTYMYRHTEQNLLGNSELDVHVTESEQPQDTNIQDITGPVISNIETIQSNNPTPVPTSKSKVARAKRTQIVKAGKIKRPSRSKSVRSKSKSAEMKQTSWIPQETNQLINRNILDFNTLTEPNVSQQDTMPNLPVPKKYKTKRTATISSVQVPTGQQFMNFTNQVSSQGLNSGHAGSMPNQTTRPKTKHRKNRSRSITSHVHNQTEQQAHVLTQHNRDSNNMFAQYQGIQNNPYQQMPVIMGNRFPTQATQQMVQQLSSDSEESSDDTSSSDDDGELNQIGSQHVQFLNNVPTEGINLNAMQFQYAEPISTAIAFQIPHKIKKKIWRNQFIDLAVLLPRTYSSNNNTNFQLQLSSKAQLSLVPNQNRKIFSIETWTSAFLRFMAVYTEQFPMEAPQLLKYTEIVRDLARRSTGLSWYLYDQQFRMLRETVQIPWGRLHTEFWVMASNAPTQRPFRNNFRQPRNTQHSTLFKGRKFIEFTCWTYNRRGICGERTCRFQHKCGLCKGSHPATNCTSQGRPSTQNTGGQNNTRTTLPSTSTTASSRTNSTHTNTQSRS